MIATDYFLFALSFLVSGLLAAWVRQLSRQWDDRVRYLRPPVPQRELARVEEELAAARRRIEDLERRIEDLSRRPDPAPSRPAGPVPDGDRPGPGPSASADDHSSGARSGLGTQLLVAADPGAEPTRVPPDEQATEPTGQVAGAQAGDQAGEPTGQVPGDPVSRARPAGGSTSASRTEAADPDAESVVSASQWRSAMDRIGPAWRSAAATPVRAEASPAARTTHADQVRWPSDGRVTPLDDLLPPPGALGTAEPDRG